VKLRGTRVSVALGLAVLGVLSLPRAKAHPFGQRYYALRTELRMKTSGPELILVGEVPIMVVLSEFRRMNRDVVRPGAAEDAAYRAAKLDQLRQGASLTVDGQPVPGAWVALDDPRNGKSAEGSFTYFLRFEPTDPWDLSADTLRIAVEAGAYEGLPLWYAAYAVAEPAEGGGWAVADNSARGYIGDAADDPVAMEGPEGWSQDEGMRRLEVLLQRHTPEATQPPPRGGGCWG